MKAVKSLKNGLDRFVDTISLIMLTAMVIIITFQVVSRYFFSYTPSWSEEISLIFLVWLSFLGIAVGFREKLHIGVGLIVNMLPDKIQDLFDIFAKALVVIVGVIFIMSGWKFTILMSNSTMAGTKLPSSVLYAAIPVCGLLMVIYGVELFFKKGMHQEFDDVDEE